MTSPSSPAFNVIKRSLALQTILLIAAITLVVVGGAAWVGGALSQIFMKHQLHADATQTISLMRLAIDKPMLTGNDEATTEEFSYLAAKFPDIHISVASFQGSVTYSTKAEDVRKPVEQAYGKVIADTYKKALRGETPDGDIVDYNGARRYMLITPIKNEPGCHHCHGASQPVLGAISLLQNMDAQMQGLIWGIALNLACGILLAIGIYIFISKRVIKRVHSLADTSDQIIAGDFNARFQNMGRDELGQLAENLGNMLGELKKLGIARSVLYGMRVPSYMCDENRAVTFVNRPLLRLLGIEAEVKDCLGMDVSMLLFGEMRSTPVFDSVVRDKQAVKAFEMTLVSRKGEELTVLMDAAPVSTLEGEFIGVFASLTDLTAIRANEKAIREQGARINQAAAKAEELTGGLTEAAGALAAQASQTRAQASTQQQLTASASAAVDDMGRVMEEVARNAATASDNARETKESADRGRLQARQVFAAMDAIETAISRLKEQMEELEAKTADIDQIMQVISDIADQTNLLALNAAIEAARAGDVGRGFAVVADEVRKLAEKTSASVGEVGRTVNEIRQSAQANVRGVLDASRMVGEGVEKVKETGDALENILKLTVAVSDEITSIAKAIDLQYANTEAISRSTGRINESSQVTLESMAASEESINSVLRVADNLKHVISNMTASGKKS